MTKKTKDPTARAAPAEPAPRILLVDDDPDDRELVTRELRKEFPGVEVRQASDPGALDAGIAAGDLDLVITDYQLHWTTGLDVLRSVRRRLPDVPVLMFTGTGNEEVAVAAMKAGLDDYILKSPKHFVRLAAAARSALDKAAAKQARRRAERRYQALFQNLPVGLFRCDADGRFTDVNRALVRILGAPAPGTLVGRRLPDLFLDPEVYPLWIKALLDGEAETALETRLRALDGRILWAELHAAPVRAEEGDALDHLEGTLEDVTERRETAEALKEREELFRDLFENASDLIQSVAPDGTFLFVNRSWKEVLGYTDEDLETLKLQDIIDPACREACLRHIQEALEGKAMPHVETIFRAKDGRAVHLEGSCNSKYVEGRPVSTRGIFRDVTHRKAAEAALARLLRRHELILNSAGEGIIGVDAGGSVTFANTAAAALLGAGDPAALTGRDVDEFWLAGEAGGPGNPVRVTLAQGRPHRAEDAGLRRLDGSPLPVEYRATPILEDGEVTGAVLTFSDISERKRAWQERERMQAQLLHAQKMEAIGTLAGGVAHDFNNLLTAIQGYTDLALLKIPEEDPVHADLRYIHRAAVRAGNLVRQLLLFSRRQPMEFTSIDLNATIRDLLKMLTRLIGEDITVETDLEPAPWPVRGDAANVDQVIMNLAVNARDAMPEGGVLTLRTRNVRVEDPPEAAPGRRGRFVALTVADTGLGMDAETLSHVFEPFFTTKEAGRGTGLGLSVVYGIVQEHGGWIDVRSEPGRGTAFTVYFPAAATAAGPEDRPRADLGGLRGRGERILLVEDEASVRDFAAMALAGNGYEVTAAASGAEARECFESAGGGFDLLLSDVVLPDATGLDLVRDLAARAPGMKVLLTSGYTDQKAQWRHIREAAVPFLQKPFTLEALLAAVKNALGGTP
ncbi:PAS domain S-box protein [Dissulfurirhabdus thermomarina]|uniref:histidine kinase n=1 Tax=Dissulfurirhabdus thermomarina TaxID=1765737 RepID=A0A6N9TLK6_DISTH|nr:PAS domain S-box protein [Dissulfurirhabdus thermomarina]NDY42115.1 PAS domain S-box protein [Dissulfurirhabdus thermomarina]NMX22863.1 PAS domain S-box protein [Dissulfurirhabdus thermomarina]